MPRPRRIHLPGIPQHVVQRGNDRQPCFFSEADYLCYRTALREAALHEGCAVHAYVLMTNHVHLLLTPERPNAVARTLQALGRRYVRYINDTYHRTGTLWEGRNKASLVGNGDYLMHCHGYIELNPLLTPHPDDFSLSTDPATRLQSYRGMVMDNVDPADVESIRRHLQQQHAFGSERFRRMIEAQLGRSVGPQKIGRPCKAKADAPQSTGPQKDSLELRGRWESPL